MIVTQELRVVVVAVQLLKFDVITFRVTHSRGKIYIGHGRLCVCVCVCLTLAACPHYCTARM